MIPGLADVLLPGPQARPVLVGMKPPDSDHDRAQKKSTAAADQTRVAFADTAGALIRLEQTWDCGLRECRDRLDDLQQGVEEALRLIRLLVDRTPRLACDPHRPSRGQ